MNRFKRILTALLLIIIFSGVVRAEISTIADTVVTFDGKLSKDEMYELAKLKLCQKALQDLVRGAGNMVLRRYWEVLRPEREIFSEPNKYFIMVKILEKRETEKIIRLKAKVTIDESAIESLIDREAESVVDRLNEVGLSVLFLARAADREIDYRENSVELDVQSSDSGEKESSSQLSMRQQTSFTTRTVDTTEILTNITSRLTDSGIRISSVQMLLPYIEESEKLKSYLQEVSNAYAGYADRNGIFRSGRTEEGVAYILSVIKKIPEHPRYFALGKIDIGNTAYNAQEKEYRGIAKCSITLWDLDAGLFPVKIATTPVITASVRAQDKKEAQKNAAEQVATETGNEILDRIRSAMLAEFYKGEDRNKPELDLRELIGVVSVETDEGTVEPEKEKAFSRKYEEGKRLYGNKKYVEAFLVFSALTDEGYAPARNILGYMYHRGEGTVADEARALELLSQGMEEDNVDPEAAYYLGVMYYNGVNGEVNHELGRKLLDKAAELGSTRAINEIGYTYLQGVGVAQDYAEALRWFRRAEKENEPLAIYNIGFMYLYGKGVGKNVSMALQYLERSSGLGYAGADYMLGTLYEDGIEIAANPGKAFWYYQRAAEKYDIDALLRLGYMYGDGDFVEQNYYKALELFRQAAEDGNMQAYCAIGIIYENGYGVNIDYAQALKYYNMALEGEYPQVYSYLAGMYRDGIGVTQDYNRAKELLEKGAELGDTKSMVDLAFLYVDGIGVAQDYYKAVEILRPAADLDNEIAQYNMGVFYERGYGVEQNYRTARRWYEKAVDKGHLAAANNLAILYLEGYGVQVDYQQAKRLFEIAVEGGHADACAGLASLYRDGNGVTQNIYTAINLYEKGAELGSAFACLQLGIIFITGNQIQADYNKAYDYCLKAADLGNAQAMYIIGIMYHEGKGVNMNADQAIHWYRMAADNGFVDAYFTLGQINEYGWFGVVVNYKDAVYWYKKAAERGHGQAQERVEALKYAY